MPPDEQDRLHKAIAGALGQARPDIQRRQLCHFFQADIEYGRGVARELGMDMSAMESKLADVITAAV
jgi:catalase